MNKKSKKKVIGAGMILALLSVVYFVSLMVAPLGNPPNQTDDDDNDMQPDREIPSNAIYCSILQEGAVDTTICTAIYSPVCTNKNTEATNGCVACQSGAIWYTDGVC